jgi:hypothetical protein
MQVHPLPPGAQRQPASLGTSPSAEAATVGLRRQLLDLIYDGQPFRTVLRDLGLTSNQVWGLAKTDQEWSEKLEAALTAMRRVDLKHD